MQRARSILERGLDTDHRNVVLWLQYAEMEMRYALCFVRFSFALVICSFRSNRQINHARNIWDRAVTILPRANQFWLKYTYMEEMVGNVAGARQVFERWMEWEPPEQAWQTYINFEMRCVDGKWSVRLLRDSLLDTKKWNERVKCGRDSCTCTASRCSGCVMRSSKLSSAARAMRDKCTNALLSTSGRIICRRVFSSRLHALKNSRRRYVYATDLPGYCLSYSFSTNERVLSTAMRLTTCRRTDMKRSSSRLPSSRSAMEKDVVLRRRL